MSEKRELAMNAAIKEAYLRQHGALRGGKQYSTDEQYQLVFQRGAEYGLDAARDGWTAINGDAGNLPKEVDRYLFRDILGNAKTEVFDFQDWNTLNDIAKGFFLKLYVAWMPIPPYQADGGQEGAGGESRAEFERDRFGQTGADLAAKSEPESECPRCGLIGQSNTLPCPIHD